MHRIYLLKSKNTPLCYVGKTKNDLQVRLYQHKHNPTAGSRKVMMHGDTEIELLDEVDDENSNVVEGNYIRKYGTANCNIAGRTMSEWGRGRYTCNKCGKTPTMRHKSTHKCISV